LVGLSHRFDETVIALRRIMHWKFDEKLFYKKRNETKFKMPEHVYFQTTREKIEPNLEFDRRLFAWLEKRFDSLVKLLGDDFEEEVKMYQRLNYLYQQDDPNFKGNLKKVQSKYKWAS